MCGIAGIVGDQNSERADKRIGVMLEALKHRGPNDEGTERWQNAVLGHRRLSIFDLTSAGHQPMLSPDGEVGIVLNGAIYNFLILRKELEKCGYKFKSQSDTEVLLHGYKEWGIDRLVEKIEGMFAFGIWDNARQSLYLVRDRLGVKPLAYILQNGRLAFASTVRAIRLAGYSSDLNRHGIVEYLEFGFLTDANSIYQDIEKVDPATILEWRNGKISAKKYWKLPAWKNEVISFEEALETTEELFLEAVEKRLQADVPIGALLSGGIDSSLVCWAISKLGGDITAFTVGVPGDEWDESSDAAKTARQLGIKHKILEMSGDRPLDVRDLVRAYPEPFACASSLGLLEISREIRQHATVLLTGDGGDDVFLGYPEHLHFWFAEKVADKTPKSIAPLLQKVSSILPKVGLLKRVNSFIGYSFGGLGAITKTRDGLPVYQNNDLLGERLLDIGFSHREIPLTTGDNLLSEFLEYDLTTRFVGEYLPKVDGGTMLHALEARSPFLDTKLWDFAATLPFSLRLRNQNLKAVLREIVRRRISPELAEGTKRGFSVPVQRWLAGRWKDHFLELMEDSLLEKEGWIRSKNIRKMMGHAERQNWAPRQLWFILVLESWLRSESE